MGSSFGRLAFVDVLMCLEFKVFVDVRVLGVVVLCHLPFFVISVGFPASSGPLSGSQFVVGSSPDLS